MRAHFGTDIFYSDESPVVGEQMSLQHRIEEFKQDDDKMGELNEFLDVLLQSAQMEAMRQQQLKTGKPIEQLKDNTRHSLTMPDFKNGKVANRARGMVVRLFDAICNCANTAVAPATRLKFRGKCSSSTVNETDNKRNK